MFWLWYYPTWDPSHPPCCVVLCFLNYLSTSVAFSGVTWLLLPVFSMTPGVKNFNALELLLWNSGCKVSKWNQSDKCFSIQQRPRQLTQTQNCWTILEMSLRQRISSILCLKPSRPTSLVIYCQFPLRTTSSIALSLWRALAVLGKSIKWTSQQNFNRQSD